MTLTLIGFIADDSKVCAIDDFAGFATAQNENGLVLVLRQIHQLREVHPAATAMRDHDRARLFKDYGIVVIEFYDASRCYSEPEQVIDDFLKRRDKG